ncbi:DUF3784 domain-containing protein [Yaniella flava]
MTLQVLITIIITALFLVLATLFINVKATFLIAGYNTMSPEEKAKYDIVSLSKFMGKVLFAISGSLLLLLLGQIVSSAGLAIASTILVVAISLFAVIYIITGNRFKIDKTTTHP